MRGPIIGAVLGGVIAAVLGSLSFTFDGSGSSLPPLWGLYCDVEGSLRGRENCVVSYSGTFMAIIGFAAVGTIIGYVVNEFGSRRSDP